MTYILRFLLATVIVSSMSLVPISAAQTNNGTITGSVQDSSGSVLISAKVVVQPSARQATTDNQGQFRISNLPAGEYTLTASYVGFTPYTTTVRVEAGAAENVSAALQILSAADSVIVTAGRLQGDAEAVNVERMSANIVQVEARRKSTAAATRRWPVHFSPRHEVA